MLFSPHVQYYYITGKSLNVVISLNLVLLSFLIPLPIWSSFLTYFAIFFLRLDLKICFSWPPHPRQSWAPFLFPQRPGHLSIYCPITEFTCLQSRTWLSGFPFTFHFHALEKEMATRSSVLAWRIPGTGSLVGGRLWGRTESDTTEAT